MQGNLNVISEYHGLIQMHLVFTYSPYLFQDPSRIPHYLQSSCLLRLVWAVRVSQTLFMVTSTVLRSVVRFLQHVPQLRFIWFFPCLHWGYGLWGGRAQKCYFHLILCREHSINMIIAVHPDHLAELMFVRFLHSKVSLPPTPML